MYRVFSDFFFAGSPPLVLPICMVQNPIALPNKPLIFYIRDLISRIIQSNHANCVEFPRVRLDLNPHLDLLKK